MTSDDSRLPRQAGATRSTVSDADRKAAIPAFSAEFLAKFKIEETLAAGAMGTVYRAIQLRLNREVAIKCPQLTGQEVIDRFVTETAILARLDHPNIVQVYAAGTDQGRPYIAFELIRGRTLAALRKVRPLTVDEAIGLTIQMLKGLGHAHSRNVLHRDIKSENAIVSADGTLKVVDFGLARSEERSSGTVQGIPIGTPAYMSPEQARGEPLDVRADLYSAGIVLFELVTGRLPFEGSSVAQVLTMQMSKPAPPLASVLPGASAALADVVARALAKRKEDRYSSAEEMASALAAVAPGSGLAGARTSLAGALSEAGIETIAGVQTAPGAATNEPVPVGVAGDRTLPNPRPRTTGQWSLRTTVPVRTLPVRQPRGTPMFAGMVGVAVLAVIAAAARWSWMHRGPEHSGRPSPPPPSPIVAFHPDVRWGAASVVASWTSTDLVRAQLEVFPTATPARVSTGTDLEVGAHHVLTVRQLQPGTDYALRGLAGGVVLFDLTGRTRAVEEQGRALARALRSFDPWGTLREIRHDFGRKKPRTAERSTTTSDPGGEYWSRELSHRLERSGLEAAVDDFEGVRDGYFKSVTEVPWRDKLALYGLIQELSELESVCEVHAMKFPRMADFRLASPGYGLIPRSSLRNPHAISLVFQPSQRGACEGARPSRPEGLQIDVGPDASSLFALADDPREARLQPAPTDQVEGVLGWHPYSESLAPVPLPPPDQVDQVQLHAIVPGLGCHNRLRVFLQPPRGEWTFVADLRRPDRRDNSYTIDHTLDPRLLVPGSKVRVELVYFPEAPLEGENVAQGACLECLSFRWTPHPAGPPPAGGVSH